MAIRRSKNPSKSLERAKLMVKKFEAAEKVNEAAEKYEALRTQLRSMTPRRRSS